MPENHDALPSASQLEALRDELQAERKSNLEAVARFQAELSAKAKTVARLSAECKANAEVVARLNAG
ncbi:hypothetical protein TrST_g9827 [Triparma strigata]|uniref:Uncharacterized protein n=1 Tax=Triparma strigata TaxID=1606541 RepID=A0A9W7C379_9STRA|nr:hypothetical protein TrST_g9827 [Triparma strigata]